MTRKSCFTGVLITLLAFAATCGWAREVTETEVRAAAANLLASGRLKNFFPNATVREVIASGAIWHVQLDPSGHLAFSGSTSTIPLLGFSADDYAPPAKKHPLYVIHEDMREKVQAEAATAASLLSATESEAEKEWDALLNPPATLLSETDGETEGEAAPVELKAIVEPLLGDRLWNQCAPWNDLTPQYSALSHLGKLNSDDVPYLGRAAIGCVVTAYSQIMDYHAWPARIDEQFSANLEMANGPLTDSNYVQQDGTDAGGNPYPATKTKYQMRFHGGLPIDWDGIEDTYDYNNLTEASRFAVARFGLLADVIAKMNFDGIAGSGTFNYIPTSNAWYTMGYFEEWEPGSDLTEERFGRCIASLDAKQPILTSIPGHAIVMDGYAKVVGSSDAITLENTYLHLNYGWGSSDATKYYYARANYYTLADAVQYDGILTGHAPKQMVQIEPLPKVVNAVSSLTWHVPAYWKEAIKEFTVAAFCYSSAEDKRTVWTGADTLVDGQIADTNTDRIRAGSFTIKDNDEEKKQDGYLVGPLSVGNANHYVFPTPFIPTKDSELSFNYFSQESDGQGLTVQIRPEGCTEWRTLDTVPEYKETVPENKEKEPLAGSRTVSLKDYANSFCQLRLYFTLGTEEEEEEGEGGEEGETESPVPYYIYDLQITHVWGREREPVAEPVSFAGEDVTTYQCNLSDSITEPGRYCVVMTPEFKKEVDSETGFETVYGISSFTFTTVTNKSVTLPEITAIEKSGSATLTDEILLSGELEGETTFRVYCNSAVTNLTVLASCPTLIPDKNIHVEPATDAENAFDVTITSNPGTRFPQQSAADDGDGEGGDGEGESEGEAETLSETGNSDETGEEPAGEPPQVVAAGKSLEDLDGTRMLLTLIAKTEQGNEAYRDLVLTLRSGNYAIREIEDEDGNPVAIEIPYDWLDKNGLLTTDVKNLEDPAEIKAAIEEILDDDADGDGLLNWQEYLCSTDPNDSAVGLGVTGMTFEDGSLKRIDYMPTTVSLAQIILQGKPTLAADDPWQTVFFPEEPQKTFRFFRVIAVPKMGQSATH